MYSRLENRAFLLALGLITLLFLFLLRPFFGAILWACVLAVLFSPLQRRLLARWRHPNSMALVTLLICLCLGVAPALLLAVAFFREGTTLYQQLRGGELNPAEWVNRIEQGAPWLKELLANFDVDITNLSQELTDSALAGSRFLAHHAVTLGQGTLAFVVSLGLMLYLLFFLLRDGQALVAQLVRALPLGDAREQLLLEKFAQVVRAIIKGNLVVALIQGTLGGLIFWVLGIPNPLLWGIVMVFMSMIPVVGSSLIWGPVAAYLFVTGNWVEGTVLAAFGVGVIGLIDNILRPLLVRRETRMPDYLILLSTLGGIALFGLNGFVLGPLVAALFMVFWGIFIRDFGTPST